jgi:outer membrane protein TolC
MSGVRGLAGTLCLLVSLSAVARAADVEEAQLAEAASLETLEALALARHPAIGAARARARAEALGARERAGLPPPELVYQQWAVPLARPYDLTRAEMVMLGARVPVPSRAVRKAESAAAARAAEAASADEQSAGNDVLWALRSSYAEYVRAQRELLLHDEHARLVADVYELAKVAYGSNQASASALHETRVALGKLHSDIVMIEADLARARVRLNLLSGRAADAPLGAPRESELALSVPEKAERPELVREARLLSARHAELKASEVAARRPDWMVGIDYMAMPAASAPWAYGAMVSMSLPWFSSALRARVERARGELEAQRAVLASETLAAELEREEARVELAAAVRSRALVEREWLGHAREAYEVEREAWAAGRSEARAVLERLDALLEARVSLLRAERDVAVRTIELARAVGGEP